MNLTKEWDLVQYNTIIEMISLKRYIIDVEEWNNDLLDIHSGRAKYIYSEHKE